MKVRLGHPRQALGWPLYMALGACLLYAMPTWLGLIWQITESEPRGLYQRRALPPTLTRGMLVTLPVPAAVEDLVYRYGWLPAGVPLLKAVAAVPGETVCVHESGVWVNGVWQAPVFRELGGVALPVLRGCWTLHADELFLMSTHIPNSLDSRYFDRVSRADVTAMAVPLWTWE